MPQKRIRIASGLLLAAFLFAATVFLGVSALRDPNKILLIPQGGAEWIRHDRPMTLLLRQLREERVSFRHAFSVDTIPASAELTVLGLREIEAVRVNGRELSFSDPGEKWKKGIRLELAPYLVAGDNRLEIDLAHLNGPTALLAHADMIDLKTGPGWQTTMDGSAWADATSVNRVRRHKATADYPTSRDALPVVLPFVLVVFAIAFAANHFVSARYPNLSDKSSAAVAGWARWLIIAAWCVLAGNNFWKLTWYYGFDVQGHMEYLEFIATQKSLPLMTDGWQTFQAPLFYIVCAIPYAIASAFVEAESVYKILRIVPMLCGVAQIELTFRALRLVFPKRGGLQILGTLFAAFLPMNVYMNHFVGNQPFTAVFEAAIILQVLRILLAERTQVSGGWFTLLGLTIGLAVLSKISAAIVSIIAVACVAAWSLNGSSNGGWNRVRPVLLTVAPAALVSGWYFIRNWIALGTPTPVGYNEELGVVWRQDPGFVTPHRLLTFGDALQQPVYATLKGPWEGIYSTMWADGLLSGAPFPNVPPPWNFNFLAMGVLIALVPLSAIVVGALLGLRSARWPVYALAALCIGGYLAAIMWVQISYPTVSATKASYMMGMTPCLALLLVRGLKPMTRNKWTAGCVWGAVLAWACTSYVAFFAW